jgi:hypothetical protein
MCPKKLLFISLPEAVFLSRYVLSTGPGKRRCMHSVEVSLKNADY